jgi:hypothetical protein
MAWTPSPDQIVTAEAKQAAADAEAVRQKRTDDLRGDAARAALLTRLQAATPSQIDAYVEANVKTIADARAMFKAMLKLIALDGRS